MQVPMFKVAAMVVALLVSGGSLGYAVFASHPPTIELGDHVKFHMTIRNATGTVVFTTDVGLALAERERGNHIPPSPDEVISRVYQPQEGFLRLSEDAGFDHAPFLLGRSEGDVIVTPFLTMPFEDRPPEHLPRILENVGTKFPMERDLVKRIQKEQNATGAEFLYLDSFPAVARPLNETHDEVLVLVEQGDEMEAMPLGFRVRVVDVGADEVSLEPILEEGQIIRTSRCSISAGVPAGRYVVGGSNDTRWILQRDDPMDHIAAGPVQIEFTVLEVKNWPEWMKAKAAVTRELEQLSMSFGP